MKTIFSLLFATLIIFAWGPWVDSSFIKEKLTLASQKKARTENSTDSCVFKDILSLSRTVFGHTVSAEYACFTPEPMKRNMFVSSIGTVSPLSKLKPLTETEY